MQLIGGLLMIVLLLFSLAALIGGGFGINQNIAEYKTAAQTLEDSETPEDEIGKKKADLQLETLLKCVNSFFPGIASLGLAVAIGTKKHPETHS
ncbi:MAG: hypothetical protein K8S55_06140 [Phycisphaerae bacterium]|nr:hypothetical protein [Phycisphaerae bacterium]